MAGNLYDEALEELGDEQTASGATRPTIYEEVLKADRQAREVRMRQAVHGTTEITPETAAKAHKLALRYGVPASTIAADLPSWERRNEADKPYAQMGQQSPNTAEWLTEHDNAAVAKDDLEQLGTLEWLVTAPQRAFAQSVAQMRLGRLRTKQLFGNLTRQELDELDAEKFASQHGGGLGVGDSWFRGTVTGGSQLLANVLFGGLKSAKGAAVGAVAAGAVSAIPGFVLGGPPGAMAFGLEGAELGAKAGSLLGAASFGFELEAGLAFDEMLAFKDSHGQAIDIDAAKGAAVLVGALNAGLEVVGLERLARSFPGLEKLKGAFARDAVKAALKSPSVRAALASAVREYGGTLSTETGVEVAQRAVTIAGAELAKYATGGTTGEQGGELTATGGTVERRQPSDILLDLTREAVGALQGFSLVALPGPAMSAILDARRARMAQQNAQWITALGEGAAASKTIERAPEAVRELLQRAVDKGPVPTLYAPTDTWRTYWTQKGLDPIKVADEVTGRTGALETAEAGGADLAIPTARYATTLAATPHNAFFATELRVDPDDMNTREAEAFAAQQQATLAAALQPVVEAGKSEIRGQLVAQLERGGLFERSTAEALATLVESGIGQAAADAGFDPTEIYRQYGLQVQRPDMRVSVPPTRTVEPPVADPTTGELPGLEADVETAAEGEAATTGTAAEAQPAAGGQEAQPAGQAAPGEATATGDGEPATPTETYAVYDRAGGRRELPGLGAEAYVPLRGETLVAETPEGVRVVSDRGGRVPDAILSPSGTNAEGRPETGPDVSSGARQQPRADEGGSVEGSGDGGGTERRRLPTAADLAASEGAQVFTRASREADAARLTPDVRRELERIVAELRELAHTERTWHWLTTEAGPNDGNAAGGQAVVVGGAAGSPVLDDILQYAPLSKNTQTGEAAAQVRGTRPRIAGDIDKVLANETIHNNLAEGAVRVAERRAAGDYRDISRPSLPLADGVIADQAFTDELSAAIDDAVSSSVRDELVNEQERDAIEGEEGDTSFDVSDFGQSLIDLFNEAITPPAADTLDTGEVQPRLPGAEAVREQEVATPQLEAPFALTPPPGEVGRRGKQTTLFQAAYHGSPHRFEKFSLHAIGTGEGAASYGWGLYFASERAVADKYRESLATEEFTADGETLTAEYDRIAAGMILGHDGDAAATRQYAQQSLARAREQQAKHPDRALDYQGIVDHWQKALAGIKRLDGKAVAAKPGGRTYTVELPDGDDYLDWDKPASEQSPKVQAALEALGIKWERFEPRSVGEVRRWLNTRDREWVKSQRDPSLTRELLREAERLIEKGNEAGLAQWQYEHQELMGRRPVDASGQQLYRALENKRAAAAPSLEAAVGYRDNAKWASEQLAAQGVPGIRYLDGFSRAAGEGTHNFVIFDDRLVEIRSYDQALDRNLLVAHNLTPENVRHAAKMGGLAVPSLAITKKDQPITGFGAITLLGDAAMADPQGYAGPQVFGADVYAPRYPTVHYTLDAAGEKKLAAMVKANPEGGQRYIDLDTVQKEGVRAVREMGAVMAAFLKSRDIAVPAAIEDKPRTTAGGVTIAGGVNQFQTRHQLEEIIRANGLQEELAAYAADLFATLKPTEKIYRGYTDSGRPSYRPHTLENVVAEIKKELRGGESSSNLYGMGQLRAKFTPRFRSLAAIRKAKGRLVSSADFEAVKAEVETEFFALADLLAPYYQHSRETFRYTDTVIAVLEESPKGLTRALRSYDFADVPADVTTRVVEFLEKLRHLPTEYFEAKILRSVDLAEFAGAVAPDNTPPDVLEHLRSRGLTVELYAAGNEDARREAVVTLADTLGERVLFQPQGGGRRGSITIGPGRKMTINLFEQADLSTFLHETGHFFLEVMGDLVERVERIPEAQWTEGQRRLMANWRVLLEQLQVEGRAGIGEAQHELFARWFEAYLYEGRAPSLEMRALFARFRAWLMSVYRSLLDLNAPLTDEVRGVFDRLLANDQALANAEAAGRVTPMFLTAEAAGMSPERFAAYRDTIQQASQRAREQLDALHLQEVRREQTELYRERREATQAEVEQELADRPAYKALAAIRYGQNPDGSPMAEGLVTEPYKLSKRLLVERYGEARVQALPRPYVYTVNDTGLDPEFVAQRFGFSSGDELIAAIEVAPPYRQAVEQETAARMQESAMRLDGTLAEAAQAATLNEDRDSVIRAELRALARLRATVAPFTAPIEGEVEELRAKARGGPAAIAGAVPPASVVREIVAEQIGAIRIRDLRPAVYWAAARRSAQAAIDAAARQDFDEAIKHKTQELISSALYREAEQAKADVDKRVREIRDLAKTAAQKRLGLAGTTYLEQINGILDRFEFAQVPQRELDKRARFVKWVEGLEGQGIPITPEDFPPELVADAYRTNYTELPLETFLAVSDGVKQIVHLARLKNKLLKAEKARTFEEERDGVVTSIREHGTTREMPLEFRPSDQRRLNVADWFAAHTRLSTFARILDGGLDGGAVWEAIQRRVNAASDAEETRKRVDGTAFGRLLEEHYPGRQLARLNDRVFIPAIGGSLSLEGRIAVALNWGNQTSRDRLLADPSRKWTQVHIDAILKTLSPNDLNFVEAVWHFVDQYWDEIKAKQERVIGIAPEKVAPAPFVVNGRELQGGYYPLKYDGRLSPRAQQLESVSQAKSLLAGAYVRSTTKRGHVETRKRNVKLSVRLDLGVAFEHIEQVIHDLTHHEMLLDVNRLLRDPQVSQAIIETRGDSTYRHMTKALEDIATGSIPPRGGWERAAKWARTGTQLAALGLNLWTAAQQPLGLFNGASRVGTKWVARGMRRWLRDAVTMQHTTEWIASASPMMANRFAGAGQNQDFAELKSALQKPGGWFDTLVRTVTADHLTQQTLVDGYLWHISVMQRVADVPTWLGAFEKAMADPANNGSEARAVALADQAVIDSQGSGSLKDLSSVQRGGEMAKLWLAFYSYGATVFNSTRDVIARTSLYSPASVVSMLADLALLYVMPAVGTVVLANLTGKDEDDEAADWFAHMGQEVLATALNTMIGARELGQLVVGGARGYAGPAGARMLQVIYQLGAQVKQGELDEALERATLAAAGQIFRFPAAQMQRTIDGIVALEEGRTHNPLAVFVGGPTP